MSIKKFQDILTWKKSHQLVLQIYKRTHTFPANEQFGLTNQIRRSSMSIPTNIVEGYTKSKKDFIRYLGIARGSLEETKYHLILCNELNYVSNDEFDDLYSKADEIGKMLYALINKLKYTDHRPLTTDH